MGTSDIEKPDLCASMRISVSAAKPSSRIVIVSNTRL
jgi:hypothetical protein